MQPERTTQYQPRDKDPDYQPPKRSVKLPVTLMAWPIIGLLAIVAFYMLSDTLFPDTPPAEGDLFGDPHPLKTYANILIFIVGGATFVLGPISFIAGIIILIKKGSKK